jgi:hypothetical protein
VVWDVVDTCVFRGVESLRVITDVMGHSECRTEFSIARPLSLSVAVAMKGDARMRVDRRIVTAKQGSSEDAVAVAKEMSVPWVSKSGHMTYRIYRPNVAPFNAVAVEWECESLAEYDRLVTEFFALPGLGPLMEKRNEAMEPGGTHEIWNLVEQRQALKCEL